MIDQAQIEKMIEDCLEAIEEDDSGFTAWEITFMESVEEKNNDSHLTPTEEKKLEQIYEERVCKR